MARLHFSINELVNQRSFRRFAKGTATPEEAEKWNSWMEESDENRTKTKTAISEIVGFEFKSHPMPDVQKEWARLRSKTSGKKKAGAYQRKPNDRHLQWLIRVAAILLLASMVGIGAYLHSGSERGLTHLQQLTEEHTISTNADEQKTLTFSNGARLVLNSNSRLTYTLGMIQSQTIQVTLEGEAWFDADNDESADPAFAVRTPDGIIRDIGTQFLVTVQQGQTRVVLQEGIVEVESIAENNGENNLKNEFFRIEKGEMVEFNRTDILTRERVNPTFYSAWATQFMQFEETTIGELADYIEGHFGVEVYITDADLNEITLDGAVYFRSLDELIRSVSEVTGIPVYRSDTRDRVYMGSL